jgi:hypothetical protein
MFTYCHYFLISQKNNGSFYFCNKKQENEHLNHEHNPAATGNSYTSLFPSSQPGDKVDDQSNDAYHHNYPNPNAGFEYVSDHLAPR